MKMKVNVIIFGCGKAGRLHRDAYMKIENRYKINVNLYYIDTNESPTWGMREIGDYDKVIIYACIDKLLERQDINITDTIIDLCVPAGSMITLIHELKAYGFKNYICEKPLVLYYEKIDYADVLKNINILMVKNYLFSEAMIIAKALIQKYSLNLRFLYGIFSKDRVNDSMRYRAFRNKEKELSVCEIEMPHLLYMSEMLFGKIDKILYKHIEDMVSGNTVLKGHGSGEFILQNVKGCLYFFESNLMYPSVQRKLICLFENKFKLCIDFAPTYNEGLKLNSKIELFEGENCIYSKFIINDDNMCNMLYKYIYDFNNNRSDKFLHIENIVHYSETLRKMKIMEEY